MTAWLTVALLILHRLGYRETGVTIEQKGGAVDLLHMIYYRSKHRTGKGGMSRFRIFQRQSFQIVQSLHDSTVFDDLVE
jgi:hypothetical protein